MDASQPWTETRTATSHALQACMPLPPTTTASKFVVTYVCEAVVEDEAEEAGGGAGVRLEPLLDDAEDDLLGIRARRLVEICRELRGGQRRGRRGREEEEEDEAETGVHHAIVWEGGRCDARTRPGHAYTAGQPGGLRLRERRSGGHGWNATSGCLSRGVIIERGRISIVSRGAMSRAPFSTTKAWPHTLTAIDVRVPAGVSTGGCK